MGLPRLDAGKRASSRCAPNWGCKADRAGRQHRRAQTCARVGFGGGHSSYLRMLKVRKQRLLDDSRLSRLKLSSDTLGGGASETRALREFAQTDYSRVSPTGNLAKTGYDIQISREMRDRDAPDDLWRSSPGGLGAHRRFDAAAKSVSAFLWLTTQQAFAAMFILILSPVLLVAVR